MCCWIYYSGDLYFENLFIPAFFSFQIISFTIWYFILLLIKNKKMCTYLIMHKYNKFQMYNIRMLLTSSSLSFSPRVESRCRSSAEEMNPLPSLSKWRKPSMKSLAVSPLRAFDIAWHIYINHFSSLKPIIISPLLLTL